MGYSIFSLFDEYGVLKAKNRLNILLNMKPVEYTGFLDKLEKILPQWEAVKSHKDDEPFDLWLPYPSETTLKHAPNYTFLFDRIYLLDPISDLCGYLEMDDNDAKNYFSSWERKNTVQEHLLVKIGEKLSADESNETINLLRRITANRLSNIISTYIENRDLIEGAILIPFTGAPINVTANSLLDFGVQLVKEAVDENLELMNKMKAVKRNQRSHKLLTDPQTTAIFYEYSEVLRFLLTTSGFKEAFPAEISSNLDFGDGKNKVYISKLIQLGTSLLGENANLVNNIRWPTPNDELSITSIAGIPPQEILNIRQKELAAIENFRYKTRKKLIDMRASAGTKDYSALVQAFQFEQKGQIAEIKMLSEHIKKNHLRKISHQVGIMAFSAAGAILSASAALQNPINLIGVGLAGAGVTSGISSLLETWISYQAEMEKLHERDSYILWRVQQGIKGKG